MTTAQFRSILFPVDFSDRCRHAEPFVIALARQFQARITALHVVHIPVGWHGSIETIYPEAFNLPDLMESAEKELASYVAGSDLPAVDRIVETGDPAARILAWADRAGVDLITMPTHGYGRFRSLLLGSVTAKVLHDADCAVWTAAHTEEPTATEHHGYRSLLCAIDFAPEGAKLIRCAADLAKAYGAELRLVHAVLAPEYRSVNPVDAAFRRSLHQWSRERIAELQRQAGAEFEVCIEGGTVASVVRCAALHHQADLVVIGRGRGQRSFGSLRSNSYAVICESPCPVLRI